MSMWRRVQVRWRRLAARGGQTGASVTGLVVCLLAAAFLLIGLTVDGGAHVRGMTRAERVATEAARAGLQAYRAEGVPDPADAVAAAKQYVAAAGADGSLSGAAELVGANHLEVTVTVLTPTLFLSAIGYDQLSATASGAADLVDSVSDGG